VPVDPQSLPEDPEILKRMLVDLTTQLDKTQRLLRQLMEAKSGTRSERLSADQLRLFGQDLPVAEAAAEAHEDDDDLPPGTGSEAHVENPEESRPRGRRALPAHLKRERIEHDLAEEEKHCAGCSQDLRRIGDRDQRALRIHSRAA
jgi:transposase